MVQRFGSGAGSVSVTEQGRVFRGAPVQRPQVSQAPQTNISEEQRQRIEQEIEQAKQELQALEAQQRANRFSGGEGAIISRVKFRKLQEAQRGISARLQFLNEALGGLKEGEAYADVTQVIETSKQVQQRARNIEESRRLRADLSKNISEPAERRKLTFQQEEQGYYYFEGRYFNPQGQEVFPKSTAEGVVLEQGGIRPSIKPTQPTPSTQVVEKTEDRSFYERFTSYRPQKISEALASGDVIVSKLTRPVFEFIKPSDATLFGATARIALEKSPIASPIITGVVEQPVTSAAYFTAFEFFIGGTLVPTFSTQLSKLAKISSPGGLPLRDLKVPEVKEITYPRVLEDGTIVKEGTYQIRTEIKAPRLKSEPGKPIIEGIEVRPSKYAITTPLTGVVRGEIPYLAITLREGSGVVKVEQVGGLSKVFRPIEDAPSLTKIEKYSYSKLLEETGYKGFNLQKESSTYLKGELATYKLTEYSLSTKTLKLYEQPRYPISLNYISEATGKRVLTLRGIERYGKRTAKYSTISELEPYLETETFQRFKIETFYKDITFPNARATGKSPRLTGELIVFKEPVSSPISESLDLGKIDSPSMPLSLKQIKQLGLDTPLPKPSPIQGVKLQSITEFTAVKLDIRTFPSPTGRVETVQEQKYETITKVEQGFRVKEIQVQEPTTKQIPSQKEISLEKQIPSQKEILLEKTITKEMTKQMPKQIEKLVPKQVPKQLERPRQQIGSPIAPLPSSREKLGLAGLKLPRQIDGYSKGQAFTVFVRRGGKFAPVAKAPTQEKAFSIGREVVSKTLGATFKIEGKGLKNIPTPQGFKKKRTIKGETLLIELPKFRLSTGTEIKEIQQARRKRR